jgi:hypothetical protein
MGVTFSVSMQGVDAPMVSIRWCGPRAPPDGRG